MKMQAREGWKEQRVKCPDCGRTKYQNVAEPVAQCKCGRTWRWAKRMKVEGGR